MKIALYEHTKDNLGNQIQAIIENLLARRDTIRHSTIETLLQALKQPMNGVEIAVLLPSTSSELLTLNAENHLFDNIRLILILPDKKEETINLGLKLYPRYFSFADDDPGLMKGILTKMIATARQPIGLQNHGPMKLTDC